MQALLTRRKGCFTAVRMIERITADAVPSLRYGEAEEDEEGVVVVSAMGDAAEGIEARA